MNAPDTDHSHDGAERPVTNRAHPRIYTIVAGSCAWFVLMVWNFATGGLVDYLLVIVSGFIFVATALMLILFSVSGNKNNGTTPGNAGDPPLREWAGWDYETRTGRIRGSQAAVQILLPIIAAAVGMTLIGIIFHFAA
jgi:hypothetical protein